jgi:N-methylhydantoinase A
MGKKIARIGVDAGGTFTDFIFFSGGEIRVFKLLSTPENPAQAIVSGIGELVPDISRLDIVHGSTVATNALLERKGAKTALITTKGFEDLLEIGRQTREELYNLFVSRKPPLIPRDLCFGVSERTLASGEVLTPLASEELSEVLAELNKKRVTSIAVCFLHSYANPENEKKARDFLSKMGISISLSSEILPEYREYERMSTTAVNSYVLPIMAGYLETLEDSFSESSFKIMQSNGGSISAYRAREEPVHTILSGPAGGVVGALGIAKLIGEDKIITFDMGGTSTDVSLCPGGASFTTEAIIGGSPVKVPIIDIHTVGAGGGSIAYLDKGGSLRVGPESAAADPGPICYGRGGRKITVTDANLVLGRLIPELFLGGAMKLAPELSLDAISEFAGKLDKGIYETASGIISVTNANMERAIRVISVERGYDPRDFALVSFGGAGGMHACDLATKLGIPRVIVPRNAGILSALGMLFADSVKGYSLTVLTSADSLSHKEIEEMFIPLSNRGLAEMEKEGFPEGRIDVMRFLDMRYRGQSYEITVPFSSDFLSSFHQLHLRRYGYSDPAKPLELVNLRLRIIGRTDKPVLHGLPLRGGSPKTPLGKKKVLFDGSFRDTPFYRWEDISPGIELPSPAIIVGYGSTAVLPPGFHLNVDRYLNLLMEKRG